MTKREFLAASIAAGPALTQAAAAALAPQAPRPSRPAARMAKTTKLFKSPQGFPNGLAATPEGLWIGEQKLTGAQAASYKLPEPKSLDESDQLLESTFALASLPFIHI